MENLYDYRDDPFDGCDFFGNSGCPGVSPPFDYTPASDAEYQQRETEIAHQVVDDLHSPDVIAPRRPRIRTSAPWRTGCSSAARRTTPTESPTRCRSSPCTSTRSAGPDYDAAFDRNGADARGIICAFMYRTDRVQLLPATADDAVLGSSPAVVYRGAAARVQHATSRTRRR